MLDPASEKRYFSSDSGYSHRHSSRTPEHDRDYEGRLYSSGGGLSSLDDDTNVTENIGRKEYRTVTKTTSVKQNVSRTDSSGTNSHDFKEYTSMEGATPTGDHTGRYNGLESRHHSSNSQPMSYLPRESSYNDLLDKRREESLDHDRRIGDGPRRSGDLDSSRIHDVSRSESGSSYGDINHREGDSHSVDSDSKRYGEEVLRELARSKSVDIDSPRVGAIEREHRFSSYREGRLGSGGDGIGERTRVGGVGYDSPYRSRLSGNYGSRQSYDWLRDDDSRRRVINQLMENTKRYSPSTTGKPDAGISDRSVNHNERYPYGITDRVADRMDGSRYDTSSTGKVEEYKYKYGSSDTPSGRHDPEGSSGGRRSAEKTESVPLGITSSRYSRELGRTTSTPGEMSSSHLSMTSSDRPMTSSDQSTQDKRGQDLDTTLSKYFGSPTTTGYSAVTERRSVRDITDIDTQTRRSIYTRNYVSRNGEVLKDEESRHEEIVGEGKRPEIKSSELVSKREMRDVQSSPLSHTRIQRYPAVTSRTSEVDSVTRLRDIIGRDDFTRRDGLTGGSDVTRRYDRTSLRDIVDDVTRRGDVTRMRDVRREDELRRSRDDTNISTRIRRSDVDTSVNIVKEVTADHSLTSEERIKNMERRKSGMAALRSKIDALSKSVDELTHLKSKSLLKKYVTNHEDRPPVEINKDFPEVETYEMKSKRIELKDFPVDQVDYAHKKVEFSKTERRGSSELHNKPRERQDSLQLGTIDVTDYHVCSDIGIHIPKQISLKGDDRRGGDWWSATTAEDVDKLLRAGDGQWWNASTAEGVDDILGIRPAEKATGTIMATYSTGTKPSNYIWVQRQQGGDAQRKEHHITRTTSNLYVDETNDGNVELLIRVKGEETQKPWYVTVRPGPVEKAIIVNKASESELDYATTLRQDDKESEGVRIKNGFINLQFKDMTPEARTAWCKIVGVEQKDMLQDNGTVDIPVYIESQQIDKNEPIYALPMKKKKSKQIEVVQTSVKTNQGPHIERKHQMLATEIDGKQRGVEYVTWGGRPSHDVSIPEPVPKPATVQRTKGSAFVSVKGKNTKPKLKAQISQEGSKKKPEVKKSVHKVQEVKSTKTKSQIHKTSDGKEVQAPLIQAPFEVSIKCQRSKGKSVSKKDKRKSEAKDDDINSKEDQEVHNLLKQESQEVAISRESTKRKPIARKIVQKFREVRKSEKKEHVRTPHNTAEVQKLLLEAPYGVKMTSESREKKLVPNVYTGGHTVQTVHEVHKTEIKQQTFQPDGGGQFQILPSHGHLHVGGTPLLNRIVATPPVTPKVLHSPPAKDQEKKIASKVQALPRGSNPVISHKEVDRRASEGTGVKSRVKSKKVQSWRVIDRRVSH